MAEHGSQDNGSAGQPTGREVGRKIFTSLRTFLARGLSEVNARILTLQQMVEKMRSELDEAISAAKLTQSESREPGSEPIHQDTVKALVLETVQKAVSDLPKPKDGRDALEIPVRPLLEGNEPSGVYIRHRGGVVRTNGGGGFDVIQQGIADVSYEHRSERSIEISVEMTDGTKRTASMHFAVPLYRGIWKQGSYERGDMVTRDGSMWHCNVQTTEAMPGTSPDWQMAVRRGDKGKDGAPGPQGPQGKAGQDRLI